MNPTEAPRAAGADPDGSGPGPEDDSRVLRAVEEYLAALEGGRPPARDEFLARHAAIAGRLGDYLDGLELIHRAGSAAGALADPDAPAGDLAGAEPLGDFLLVREIGRGGMGVVYEAVQRSLNRRVALKVLPFAATMDPRHLQRFKNEAQAAACLHHPHIVPVFGVGCERGVHYYAMQLIDGQTLAAVIAGLRRAGGKPVPAEEQPTTPHVRAAAAPRAAASTERAPLDRAHYRRVAGWGIQAAEALDQAHALGIVHRDVKPANLLVDGRDNLWVTDFGLAQVRSDARVTMTGDLVGTLRYMSPEQALAKRVVVDHRTDVYSLGATLYELLTLEPAYSGADRQELLRQIAFEEPKPPRRINKAIPAELETILLKAMEKNAADRYATAQELADDLRRFLADEPIRARPAGVARRLRKWGRRHPAWVAAAGALVLAVLLLGGVAVWQELGQRSAAEHVVEAALERAELLQQQERWDEALAVLAVAEGQLEGHGLGALRQRVEQSRRDVEMLRKLEEARLQQAAGNKDKMFDFAGSDRLYAAAFEGYGLDISGLGHKEAAERVRDSAIGDHLIAGLDDWADVWDKLEPKSGGPLRAVADLADDDPWRRRLREATARRDRASLEGLAEEERALSQPSAYLELLAIALANADGGAMAERLLRQAQAGRPADFWINFELANTLGFRKKPADPAEAVRFYQAALALRPHSPVVHNNLGAALADQGRHAEAEAAIREAIALSPKYALVHANLGKTLQDKGDLDGAIAEFREAIRYKADYPEAHNGLGTNRGAKGDLDGAIAEYREALRIKKDYAEAHYNLGNALEDKGDVDGAIAEWREAIRCKADHPEAHCNLGEALWGKGQLAEALTHLRRGHELGSKDPRWPYPSARWVKDCERHVELEPKLPAILSGQGRPADAAERSEYASLCQKKHLYAAAARLYREAITASPELVASPENGLRFDAAGNAALAGCGAGEDAAQLTDVERARLRQQALAWLRADLDAWRGLLDKDPAKASPAVAQQMLRWLRETYFLNGVRGPDALAKLPEAERPAWQQLWGDVQRLLDRAAATPTPAPGKKP